jgi:uncharacterized membrane protein YcaP (DUF421 family)
MTPAFLWFLSTIWARTGIVLVFLVVGLRLLGKRQIGQMNIYDLAMIIALANAVQNAMTGGKGDLSVGIVSAGTLILIGWGLSLVFVRVPRLEPRVVGEPTLLINDGHILWVRMHKERVTEATLMTSVRKHGLSDVHQVMMAVLEVDGEISIVPKSAVHKRTRKRIRSVDNP